MRIGYKLLKLFIETEDEECLFYPLGVSLREVSFKPNVLDNTRKKEILVKRIIPFYMIQK